jgi:hypothetical protein
MSYESLESQSRLAIDGALCDILWRLGPPSGVVTTFLLTDIEGSTRRRKADADAMRVALATHDLVFRDAI